MEKKTIREMYAQIIANHNLTTEEVDFINGRIAQLDKKSGTSVPTERQVENNAIAEQILVYVGSHSGVTVSTVAKHFDLSTQRVTPIMTKLVNEGKLVKEIIKRVNHYTAI